MKTIVLANQKGGVGKSAVADQFAFYLAMPLKKRVLFIDLDHQANSSKVLAQSGHAAVAAEPSSVILAKGAIALPSSDFVVVRADDELKKVEKQPANHNTYASNLQKFLKSVDDRFDVCIIDTNPNPDIRMTAALVVADFALSPIQLNQEAIDGIAALRNDVAKIKQHINPALTLIGILPNLVENTPFQRDNLAQIVQHFRSLLIPISSTRFATISTRTAVAEAQAGCMPIWKLPKTSARDAWREIKPTFDAVLSAMGETTNGP